MSQFRPLLGAKVDDLTKLRFPLFASPKLDGVRAIWYRNEFLSRTLKTIPNRELRAKMAAAFSILGYGPMSGWDGELIYGEPTASDCYRKTNSAVMTIHGSADRIRFFVFDNCEARGGFWERMNTYDDILPHVVRLDQILMEHVDELLAYEEVALRDGYEGVVLRAPEGVYKHGRSTLREQYMLKLKRFTDAEATCVGFEELMHNANAAKSDERGYTKRSSHVEGKVPMDTLGALVCEMGGSEFRIGTGFTQSERDSIWRNQGEHRGKLVKFKHLAIGSKDLPRHPVFLGWRDRIDT
jgi:DNA ligase 1